MTYALFPVAGPVLHPETVVIQTTEFCKNQQFRGLSAGLLLQQPILDIIFRDIMSR